MLKENYEQGLKNLHMLVQRQSPELLPEFRTLEQRYRKILERERLFGHHPNNTAENNEAFYALVHFTQEHFVLDFIELCRTNESPVPSSIQTETSASTAVPRVPPKTEWIDETEITVRGNRYIIHEPVEKKWAADGSALRLRAKAQQIGADRVVWIKHVQLYRATSTATAWKEALEKEERLLDMLESEQRANFPRCLALETTTTSATLIHVAAQGSEWTQFVALDEKPLDRHLTYMLFHSLLPLCEMLKVLHQKCLAHRMLAPENILLMQNRNSIVQDVGLATYAYTPGEGPKLYRAPEQAVANRTLTRPGPQTDVYQLGMILYHLATGSLPLSASDVLPPSVWNGACSPAIDAAILRAISLQPEKRWQTMHDFAFALKKALQ